MAELHELKVGQVVYHSKGFRAEILSVVDDSEITVKVLEVFPSCSAYGVYVGESRNVFARYLTVVEQSEEAADEYEVTIEFKEMKIATDVENLKAVMEIITKL